MAFTPKNIDHVVVCVSDLDRALKFYCDVLGCTEERRVERIGLIQLRAGASMIDLQLVKPAPEDSEFSGPTKNMDHFALRIEPFDPKTLLSHLADHGIDAGEVVQRYGAEGDGPSVYIDDPDGNTIELKGPAGG
ncbi:VOC family protein [Pelagibius sp. CAU 1746]|uniref:VOC family protein n=1 Tax=Pelagibius sp. CAU 1746 TaxID=3140370 RepID=UPI00325B8CF6